MEKTYNAEQLKDMVYMIYEHTYQYEEYKVEDMDTLDEYLELKGYTGTEIIRMALAEDFDPDKELWSISDIGNLLSWTDKEYTEAVESLHDEIVQDFTDLEEDGYVSWEDITEE